MKSTNSYLKQTGYTLKYKSEQCLTGLVESSQCYKPKFHGTKRVAAMPKVQYPPQGGEKHLCFTLFCTMMLSVVSAVAIIYAIVIIYLPAKVVLESTLQGPKMCTTLSKEGNLSGIETCQDWSSCEEWCLSIVSRWRQFMTTFFLHGLIAWSIKSNIFSCFEFSGRKHFYMKKGLNNKLC